MIIGIDFDGTCVKHAFPKIGEEIDAVPVLKELTAKGHKLILWTMRSDIEKPQSSDYDIHPTGGNYLTEAVNWFRKHDILLYGVNINPSQATWTKSPKAYCHLYIDDAALGCPLIQEPGERPYVDWFTIQKWLKEDGVI